MMNVGFGAGEVLLFTFCRSILIVTAIKPHSAGLWMSQVTPGHRECKAWHSSFLARLDEGRRCSPLFVATCQRLRPLKGQIFCRNNTCFLITIRHYFKNSERQPLELWNYNAVRSSMQLIKVCRTAWKRTLFVGFSIPFSPAALVL